MAVKYVFEFVEELSDNKHMVVRETRDEVIDRINNMAKDLAQDDKTYKQYIIRRKKDHAQIIKGINDLIGEYLNTIEIHTRQHGNVVLERKK